MLSNRWHLKEYAGKKSRMGYFEWKYFNFSSANISGFFVFIAADTIGAKGAFVVARVFHKNKTRRVFGGAEKFEIESAYFSPQNVSAKMGENEIFVRGKICKISGKTGGCSWELEFEPILPPIAAFRDLFLDPLSIERASWFIAMPKAKVSGKIKIGRKKIKISAFGYSDSNWGSVFPLFARFDWGQYNDKNIAVVFGKLENPKILSGFARLVPLRGISRSDDEARESEAAGGIYIVYKGEKIKFKPAEMEIEHLKWKVLSDGKTKVPALSFVRGENKNYKIIFSLKTKKSDALYLDFSFLFKPGIIEQTALFEGKLFKKTGKNDVLLYSFSGGGFKEYAIKKYFLNEF